MSPAKRLLIGAIIGAALGLADALHSERTL